MNDLWMILIVIAFFCWKSHHQSSIVETGMGRRL